VHFQYTPYILPRVASSGIAGLIALYGWERRSTTSGGLVLACAEWSPGYTLEIAGADLTTKIFWRKSQYIGESTDRIEHASRTMDKLGKPAGSSLNIPLESTGSASL